MAEMTDWNAETKWFSRNERNGMNKEMWCSSSFATSTAVMTKYEKKSTYSYYKFHFFYYAFF